MIYERTWQGGSDGTMLLFHGLGEHCGRYDELATFLAGKGIAVHGMDWPGHGQSEGLRGHIASDTNELLGLLTTFIDKHFIDKPLVLVCYLLWL